MKIRSEEPEDRTAIRGVHEAAFETRAEADLVDALRDRGAAVVARVAEVDERICGHIVFSPITLSGHHEFRGVGLAPMAVVPERQREGIGSALVRAGIDRCRELGYDGIVVLGHPEYYPRFGFVPAVRFGLASEYEVPDEVFMAMELRPGSLAGRTGIVRYHAEFANV